MGVSLPEVVYPDIPESATIQERFEAFHAANPQIYDYLVSRALAIQRNTNIRRMGIAMLFELLRYDGMIQTRGDSYKLNNDFKSRYSRYIMASVPYLEGFFTTRELKAE